MTTFAADTTLDCFVKPGLGWRRGALQRYARGTYSAIVVHTTGRGVHRKAKRWGVSPFVATMRIFVRQTETSGHYVVDQLGRVGQVVPEEVAAWHVGGKGSRKYHRARWWEASSVVWWRVRWPQFTTPYELAGGKLWLPSPTTGKPSCNANTVGIEVIPPEDNGAWSPECWAALGRLCRDIGRRRQIPLSLETVVGHADAHPFSRSARGKPWDPPPNQWSFSRFAAVVDIPLISGVGSPT